MPTLQEMLKKKKGHTLADMLAEKKPQYGPLISDVPEFNVPTVADPSEPPPIYPDVKKPIGIKESVAEEFRRPASGLQYLPISGGLVGMAENLMYLSAGKRLQQKDYDYSKPIMTEPSAVPGVIRARPLKIYSSRKKDVKMIEDLLLRIERQQQGYTFGGLVAKGLLNLPTWMAEFAMTGGLAALGSKGAQNTGVKLMGKYAKTKAGQAALRAAGWTGGAITRSTFGLAPRIGERATGRQVEVQILGTRDEGWATSFAKAWGDLTIEAASETAGQTITAVPARLLSKSRFGKIFVNKLRSGWMKATGGKAGEFARKIATKGGYSNIIGEMGEEWLGTTLRAITDVEDFGAGKDAGITERLTAGLKEHAKGVGVEAVVLSTPFAGQVVLGRMAKRLGLTGKATPKQLDIMKKYNDKINNRIEQGGPTQKADVKAIVAQAREELRQTFEGEAEIKRQEQLPEIRTEEEVAAMDAELREIQRPAKKAAMRGLKPDISEGIITDRAAGLPQQVQP
jgi:hypothetical protein